MFVVNHDALVVTHDVFVVIHNIIYVQGKQQQECKEKLVDKSLAEEVSEDEAIGEELDSFPPLTAQMMDEVTNNQLHTGKSRDVYRVTRDLWHMTCIT